MENYDATMVVDNKYSNRIFPFGAQYLSEPRVNNPGPVGGWSCKPKKEGLELTAEETASWPGITGTGPTMREDERHMESG